MIHFGVRASRPTSHRIVMTRVSRKRSYSAARLFAIPPCGSRMIPIASYTGILQPTLPDGQFYHLVLLFNPLFPLLEDSRHKWSKREQLSISIEHYDDAETSLVPKERDLTE